MEFKQVSQNGIIPQTPLKTRQSKLGLMISTTSTIYGEPVILRAVSDASLNKFEPAYFYNYRTNGSTSTYTLIGTSTWEANIATLVTTELGTGTNNVYCVWPGEGPFAPQTTWPNVGVIQISSAAVIGGFMTISAFPQSGEVVVGEGPVTFGINFTTTLPLRGNVQIYANDVLLGLAPITNNEAFFTTSELPAGINKIKAVYPSTNINGTIYQAKVATLDYNVLRGNTVFLNMDVSFDPEVAVTLEGDIKVRATIAGSNNLPGRVKFYKGKQFIGSGAFVGDTAEAEMTNNLPVGTQEFTAVWDGNQDGGVPKYIEKTSTATLTIVPRDTVESFVLTASTYEDVYDTSFPVLYATATTPSNKKLVGKVNFYESGNLFGQADFVDNTATFVASNLTTGTYFITAKYGGSTVAPKFYSTVSNAITFNVITNFTASIALSGSPNPVYQLNTGTFTVTASSQQSSTYSGIVTVSDISYVDNVITTATLTPISQTIVYDIEDVAFIGTETLVTFKNITDLIPGRDLRFMYPDLGLAPWLVNYQGPKETGIYKIISTEPSSNTILLHGPKYNTQDSLYDVLEYWTNLYPSGISTSTYQNTIFPGFEITPGTTTLSPITVRNIISTEVLGTGTWLTSNTFNLTFDPNTVENNNEYSHYIQASWPGQPQVGTQKPYGPTFSNLFNQQVTTATLNIALSTTTITVADPLKITSVVNTASVNRSFTMNVLRNGTAIANTATINNSGTITLSPGTFAAGNYTVATQWQPTTPVVKSPNVNLTVNNRADYPGQIIITGGPTYQLDPTQITVTASLNTATTGTIELFEIVGANSISLGSKTIDGQRQAKFNFNTNQFSTFDANRVIKATWSGQDWVPNVYYPYNSKSSSNTNYSTNLATLTVSSNTATNVQTSSTIFTAQLNTSTAYAGTVTWFLNEVLLDDVSISGTSTTITIPPGGMSLGNNYLKAVLEDTKPRVISNSFLQKVLEQKVPTIRPTEFNNTFFYYNQDNTINTATWTYSAELTGFYRTHQPFGTLQILDPVAGQLDIENLVEINSTQTSATLGWNPANRGQTIGTKTLTVVYGGDYWNKTTSTSVIAYLRKPVAQLSISSSGTTFVNTTSAEYFLGYPVTLIVNKNSDTVLNSLVKANTVPGNSTLGSANFVGNTATIQFTPGVTSIITARAVYEEDQYHELSTSTNLVMNIIAEPVIRYRAYYTSDNNTAEAFFTENETYYVGDPIEFRAKMWKTTTRPLPGTFKFYNYARDKVLAQVTLKDSDTVGTFTSVTLVTTATTQMDSGGDLIWGWYDSSSGLFAGSRYVDLGNGSYYYLSTQQIKVLKNPVTLTLEYKKGDQYYSTWPYVPGDVIEGYRITRTSTRNIPYSGTMTASNTAGSATFLGAYAYITSNAIDYGLKGQIGYYSANSSEDNNHATATVVKSDPYPNGVVKGNPAITSYYGNNWWTPGNAPLNITMPYYGIVTTGPVSVTPVDMYIVTSNVKNDQGQPVSGFTKPTVTKTGMNTFTITPSSTSLPPKGKYYIVNYAFALTGNPYNNSYNTSGNYFQLGVFIYNP